MSGRTVEEIIEVKRDGGRHDRGEIERLVSTFVAGETPDYQMSAWMMAALLNGLDARETVDLTRAMAQSGRMVDLSGISGLKADKHSTGGVGDKTTLVLTPLVASMGVPVAKMSGRGLGHTGGTIDKLEAIPGFRTTMGLEDFTAQVADVGCAVIAGREDIDPADKKMYALRDVTATVPSVPLIVGSIISKKIAGGADVIVLDVKTGSGAFMKTESEARELARALSETGEALGRRVACVLTDMDQPLGCAVGNALEVAEAVATLRGEGPGDLTALCLGLGAKMVAMAGRARDEAEARTMLEETLAEGRAAETFRAWVAAQGGDPAVADEPDRVLPSARHVCEVTSPESGYVSGFDAEAVGRAAMVMGAGRATAEDEIDPTAGLVLAAKVGDRVRAGAPLAVLHAPSEERAEEGGRRLLAAVRIAQEPPKARPLFREA